MNKNSFISFFIVLASGTALAQAVPALVSPILTRMYSPSDFGLLAVFMAMVSTFTPAICGRYEVAMVLPKSNIHGQHLFGIAVYFALIISIMIFVVFILTGDRILTLLHAENLQGWIFFVPVVLFLTGLFNTASYFSNRQKKYKLLSQSKITQALTVASVSIILGLLEIGFIGLLLGYLLGLLLATIFLIYKNQGELSRRVMHWGRQKKLLLYRYRHYPLYNGTTGFLNGLTLSLPVFFLSHYFPESIVGYFALVVRVSRAPVSFISASVSQIHLKKVVDLANERKAITPYLLKLTFVLVAVVLVPSLVIIFWAPEVFAVVFGGEWAEAGRYAQILMPAIAVSFVASTLSTTLGATNNNHLAALWRTSAFVTTLVVFAWFAPKGDIFLLLYAMLINDIVLYTFYYALIMRAAMKPRNLI